MGAGGGGFKGNTRHIKYEGSKENIPIWKCNKTCGPLKKKKFEKEP